MHNTKIIALAAALGLAAAAWAQTPEKDQLVGQAVELRARAGAAYGAGDYDGASALSREAMELLRRAAALPGATRPFPAEYRVRLIPGDRDSLSKIAGYPFVYNDRNKWTVLYKANKDKMPQPMNEDLILPDMVMAIPSIAGENRSGTWEETAQYDTFGSK